MFHIVLYQPEIPQNSGNLIRLCAATGCQLHLIRPLGFQLDDARMKRAGLDYFERSSFQVHESLDQLLNAQDESRFRFFTTHCSTPYTRHDYREGDWLVFGPESRGLPSQLLELYPEQCLTIPMPGRTRSLNLANSAAIAVYEGLRQCGAWPE
ncbi:MAG: tRNA (cytidine(34)-2'-O)-methyltransferase [Calditrichaeota bacterium]|nr:tRNA (cytidine(34)-2'-O)-methyltransferase [Candidatus Cloacimonadota bacterium]MCA9785298.1 tRNA (cytidine(34)-2'-O)-methyltransferase [Candidatus Cloacimonadota bacterium]MCB1047753.1 tRNA (cytidine(34)-2'-O)-methyltransferase [Calditrichota bacterium]MCB9474539.1 tRNA (cytidine(34)-2'-O)-methyltransferase [Candidatus Delongbacteria bacterium]